MFPAGASGIRTRQVTLGGNIRLRVAEAGDPAAPPVLLLHGWGASIYMWRAWFARLAEAGRRPIAIDLPGHGLSDKPDDDSTYRLASLVATVRDVLDVAELSSVDVVAQSMAGTIALELLLTGEPRIRRLALINPACFGRIRLQALGRLASPSFLDVLLPRLVTRRIVGRAHRLAYGDAAGITPRDEEEYWAPSQFPAYSRAMRRLIHEFAWRRPPVPTMAGRLRGLARDVLIVLGARDRLVRDAEPYVAALQAAGARLQVRRVPGGGHAVNEERAEEVMSLVLKFLDG